MLRISGLVAATLAIIAVLPGPVLTAPVDPSVAVSDPSARPSLAPGDPLPAGTTKTDFFRGGSQPSAIYEQVLHSQSCGGCHGTTDAAIPINQAWGGSMHALSARDPLWFACLTVAEQDAPFVGDMCIRCHVPRAWISGRSSPTDGSAINFSDRDSVNCHFCHRMLNPFYDPDSSPPEDEQILANLVELPVTNGSGSFVLDPLDRRRGKRGIAGPHAGLASPFHDDPALCETCHDVSNPTLDRQPDDTYTGNTLDEPHPTGDKYDMYPGERTFSEWKMSEYAAVGVDAGGRFGGNKQVVSTCQDCHMPDLTAASATAGPVRTDTADHGMYGGGTWIPAVVANLYPDEVDPDEIAAGIAGSRSMLQRAATLDVVQSGDTITVRVTNETGHKLPTGQPEGRLMWLNVQFFNAADEMIAERGAYDTVTAMPNKEDTEVFEILLGIDEATAQATTLPVGPTHHIAFCNMIYQDNRIPPRGFTNEAFRQIQSPVVAAGYSDGQYWDDTEYGIALAAARVTVSLYYKTATTDFIEFLRDANHTNNAGQILYDQWVATGKCPPELMASATVDLMPFSVGNYTGGPDVDLQDYALFWACVSGPDGGAPLPACAPGNLDGDADIDLADVARFLRRFGS